VSRRLSAATPAGSMAAVFTVASHDASAVASRPCPSTAGLTSAGP
jgi:hypothetical protein